MVRRVLNRISTVENPLKIGCLGNSKKSGGGMEKIFFYSSLQTIVRSSPLEIQAGLLLPD